MITEFVNFKVLDTTTNEQLISTAGTMINDFMKKQDGYIDAELLKDIKENTWFFVYHYESLEKVNNIVKEMRNSKEFAGFTSLLVPGSISVAFFHHLRKW